MPLTISHVKSNTIADWAGTVTVANSTGGSSTVAASNLVRPSDWNSAHATALSLTGAEVASLFNFGNGLSSTTDASGITAGISNASFFEPFAMPNTNSTLSTLAVGSWYFEPVILPFGLASGRINLFRTNNSQFDLMGTTITNATASLSAIASFRDCIAFYKRGTGANTTRLESVWTGENALSYSKSLQFSTQATNASTQRLTANETYGFISQINTAGATTSGTYTVTGSTLQAASVMSTATMNSAWQSSSGSSNNAFFTGSACIPIPFNTSLPPGQYWLGHMFTTHSSATTAGVNMSLGYTLFNTSSVAFIHLLENTLTAFKQVGLSTVGNSSSCPVPFHGVLLTTTSNATSNVATANLAAGSARIYWNYIQDQVN
jgi:hypothetical protein